MLTITKETNISTNKTRYIVKTEEPTSENELKLVGIWESSLQLKTALNKRGVDLTNINYKETIVKFDD